ncbi:MAG: hypothetical protein JKY33_10625 [Bacteroidia bacterium]|nr:hypothetical protein [Bacteroidia bacterium]
MERIQNKIIERLNNLSLLSGATKKRLLHELSGIVGLLKDGYKEIGRDYAKSTSKFLLSESGWQSQALSGLAESEVAIISIPEIAGFKTLDRFEGKTFREHLSHLARRDSRLLRRAIVDGVSLGRSNAVIADEIAGSLKMGKRDLQTLIRTGIQSNAAAIKDAYLDQYSDVIAAVYWMATLDGRVTVICRTRDGLKYTADTKQPIDHGVAWIGGPPAHFNCRSVAVPITANIEGSRAGFDFNKESRGKPRSSIRVDTDANNKFKSVLSKGEHAKNKSKNMGKGRQYSANLEFKDWFKTQPAWFQDEYLGKKKARLYRRGGLTLEKFSEKASRSLTLKELEKLYPRQWEQAFS